MDECSCAVCVALSGLAAVSPEDLDVVARSLPEDVSRVMAAYARIVDGCDRPGDRDVVMEAARACTGERFGPVHGQTQLEGS